MRILVLILAASLLGGSAAAQRHKIGEINTETEEGKLLQAIGTQEDAAEKLRLMEAFVEKRPRHEAAGWVWSQLQTAYVAEGRHDKALHAGNQLLALDADDLDAAYTNLKTSEAKKDSDAIIKWAVSTSDIARKAIASPKKNDEEEDDHKRTVDYASQVEAYTQYSLYAAALTETEAPKVLRLVDALEQRNAKSDYLPQVMGRYAWAARESNSIPAGVAFGERAWERGQFNEDLLLAMADHYMNSKPAQTDKVLLYSGKLVEVMEPKPAPEGVSQEDWNRKKTTMLGLAHWMAGTTYGAKNQYAQADKSLRAALPLIKDNDQLMAGALFYLGLANYEMGKGRNAAQLAEGLKFMQQCAAIRSPYQAHAQKNVAGMRQQTGRGK
jgi:tetratricopeptide (TPR) repeat protein